MITAYDSLWKAFIRPTRQTYQIQDLGLPKQRIKDYIVTRHDVDLQNSNCETLKCSLFEPQKPSNSHPQPYPCVIYCHGNSGSRLDALQYLQYFVQHGIGLFCFDFSGSGNSDGEYVTLGYQEKNDLQHIVEYLRKNQNIQQIGLFGRSMGAVTSLLYCEKDQNFTCLVLDSPFSNLRKLAVEIAQQKFFLPNFLLEAAVSLISLSIEKKVGFSFDQLDLRKVVPKINIPSLFVSSFEDKLVNIQHSQELKSLYGGKSIIKVINGNHNAERSHIYKKFLAEFFLQNFENENSVNEEFKENDQIQIKQKDYDQNNLKIINRKNILQQNNSNNQNHIFLNNINHKKTNTFDQKIQILNNTNRIIQTSEDYINYQNQVNRSQIKQNPFQLKKNLTCTYQEYGQSLLFNNSMQIQLLSNNQKSDQLENQEQLNEKSENNNKRNWEHFKLKIKSQMKSQNFDSFMNQNKINIKSVFQ